MIANIYMGYCYLWPGSESEAAQSLAVQFRCKHTFCEICVREFPQAAARRGRSRVGEVAVCPRCRANIGKTISTDTYRH